MRKRTLATGSGAGERNSEKACIGGRTKFPGRCVQLEQIRKVALGKVTDKFQTEQRQFVPNAFLNWEPVKSERMD